MGSSDLLTIKGAVGTSAKLPVGARWALDVAPFPVVAALSHTVKLKSQSVVGVVFCSTFGEVLVKIVLLRLPLFTILLLFVGVAR